MKPVLRVHDNYYDDYDDYDGDIQLHIWVGLIRGKGFFESWFEDLRHHDTYPGNNPSKDNAISFISISFSFNYGGGVALQPELIYKGPSTKKDTNITRT